MECDHDATRASLQSFLLATHTHKFQVWPWGEVHLNGNCVACDSTLVLQLCDCRGHVERHGEIDAPAIETAPGRCIECLGWVAPQPRPDPNEDDRRIS